MDNGPEFTGTVFTSWCQRQSITIRYIQPGKPMQNAYIERLNRTYREDVLDAYLFESLEQVRIQSDEWQYKYNYLLPHGSLDERTPAMMRECLSATHHSKQTIEHHQQILTQHQNKQLSVLNDDTTTKKSKLALS